MGLGTTVAEHWHTPSSPPPSHRPSDSSISHVLLALVLLYLVQSKMFHSFSDLLH
jgi:hypothetical protein